MSCSHGNHVEACDLCDEVEAARESGRRSSIPEVGDLIPTWFGGNEPPNMSRVLSVRDLANGGHVLRLSAPNTDRGWMELTFYAGVI